MLRVLRKQGVAGGVRLGDPEYYRRFGFQSDPKLMLPDVPAKYFQAIRFDSSQPHADVSYPAAFRAQV